MDKLRRMSFPEIRKILKKDFSGLPVVKIALLGDNATQLLVQSIRASGYARGLNLEIWEAGFDQVERQVMDSGSALYQFAPEIVIVFYSTHKLLNRFNTLDFATQETFATQKLEKINFLVTAMQDHRIPNILFYNFNEYDDGVFGNFANKTPHSFLYQLRTLNYELMKFAEKNPGFFICDISSIQNQTGRADQFKPAMYIHSDLVFNPEIYPVIAEYTVDTIAALKGKFRKCLVFDLDNTIWGGVIGDDGMEKIELGYLGIGKAYTEIQYWIKKLKNRGIILAVCSKNDDEIAREPFEKHPEMVLHPEDISIFVANWESKADNLVTIRDTLNIGFDSMVFLDDNPFERNLVREKIPEICVPELPEDPADFLPYLYSLHLFETVSISDEDIKRTQHYRLEAERQTLKKQFTDERSFLEKLDMQCEVNTLNDFNIPRVAQLSQRTNQFNLRTVRYSDSDLRAIASSEDYLSLTFSLEDTFGDHGLISACILKKESGSTLFIESWFMSCRVFGRTAEHFVLNTLVDFALNKGFRILRGEYIPTGKNEIVSRLFGELGFQFTHDAWLLDLSEFQARDTCVHAADVHRENLHKHKKARQLSIL